MTEHKRFFNPSDINWSDQMAGQAGSQPFFSGLLRPFRGGGANPSGAQPGAGGEPAGGMGVQPGQGGGAPNTPGSSMRLNPGQGGQPGGGDLGNNGGGNPSGSNFVIPGQGGGQPQQGNPNPNGGGQGNTSPLDKFSSLWKNSNVDEKGQPIQSVDPFSQPLLNADPTKIAEAASSHDFTRSIPPELMQKAMSGDAGSMVQIINHVGQQSLAVAAQLSTATAEYAGKGVQSRFDQAFESRYRKQQLQQQKSTNPVLNHPNAAPLLQMLRNQAASNNPGWSPEECSQWAESYIMDMSGELRPGGGQGGNEGEPTKRPGQVDDWDDWAGLGGQ